MEDQPPPFEQTLHESIDQSQITSTLEQKRHAIRQASKNCDKVKLVEFANSSGGLLDDELRKAAWPLLLNAVDHASVTSHDETSWQHLPAHRDEEQVQKDVDRAFVYYPKGESQSILNSKKATLFNLITKVLRTHQMLCYFQGYHDIAAVLLLVLEEDAAFLALSNLSLFRIRDYMLPTIRPAEKHLHLIPAILSRADPILAKHISRIPVFYALAGTLTLYAHDIPNFKDITRLYDFLLAHEPVMAIYLFAAIIIQQREKILEIPQEDTDMIHFTLTKLSHNLDLEQLITNACQLFTVHPPEKLPAGVWRRLPSSSVLKTSRAIFEQQSIADTVRFFDDQKRIIKWDAQKHKAWVYVIRNKRPLISLTTAVLFAMVSFWIRRSGHDNFLLSALWRFSNRNWRQL